MNFFKISILLLLLGANSISFAGLCNPLVPVAVKKANGDVEIKMTFVSCTEQERLADEAAQKRMAAKEKAAQEKAKELGYDYSLTTKESSCYRIVELQKEAQKNGWSPLSSWRKKRELKRCAEERMAQN